MLPPELDRSAGLMDVDPSDEEPVGADLSAIPNKDLVRINAFKTVGQLTQLGVNDLDEKLIVERMALGAWRVHV